MANLKEEQDELKRVIELQDAANDVLHWAAVAYASVKDETTRRAIDRASDLVLRADRFRSQIVYGNESPSVGSPVFVRQSLFRFDKRYESIDSELREIGDRLLGESVHEEVQERPETDLTLIETTEIPDDDVSEETDR